MKNADFFGLYTDLADESEELLRGKTPSTDSIECEKSTSDGVNIFSMTVKNEKGERLIGKRRGRYFTVDVGNTAIYDTETFERICNVFSSVICKFTDGIREKGGSFLLAGLGNPDIACDAVGSETVSNFIVTRHIRKSTPELFEKFGFYETAAFVPDVYGNTGIEAAEALKGIADDIRPSCIIAVDALASRRLSKLASTVQICDTGICPGSGVGNARAEISQETMGVPVIAIGVPTVVSATTLVMDMLSEAQLFSHDTEAIREKIGASISGDCFVSKKECAAQVKSISRLIGYSLNKAIHKNMEFSEMRDFL